MTVTNPVTASVRAELMRLRKWPAVWVTLTSWLLLSAMFGYLFPYLSYTSGDATFADEGVPREALLAGVLPAAVPDVLVQGMPMFGGALMLVLGAIVAGSGYGWGTWKTVFTKGPSRTAGVVGSIIALLALVAGIVLVTLALDFGIATTLATVESQPLDWPGLGEVLSALGGGYLVVAMWALAGFALGTLARGPALSVGLGLVWVLVVENLLRGVGALLGPVEAFTEVLPGTAGGSLVGALVASGTGGSGTPGVLTVLSGTQATWTVAAYAMVLSLLAVVLVRRRDLV
jgi:ABC-2 type transport system permease protein